MLQNVAKISVTKLSILIFIAQSALAATCADLSLLHPPNTAITMAQTVEAGALPMTGPGQTPNLFKTLPAFCRVAATLKPTPAPNRVVASRTNPDRTRPLCAYPLVALYKGTGSTDAADSFVCGRLR